MNFCSLLDHSVRPLSDFWVNDLHCIILFFDFHHLLIAHPVLLSEGKLKKWDTVDEVHKSIDIPEAPKKNGTIPPPGHIPLPPPPPPAQGLAGVAALSSLMRSAKHRSGGDSPDSSIYSPGIFSYKMHVYLLLHLTVLEHNYVLLFHR